MLFYTPPCGVDISRIFCRLDTEAERGGRLGSLAVEHLSLAQAVILESQDPVPHRAPCMEPASPSACVSLSLSVPFMNK